ncbi:DUF6612 family protein [Ornithinibacillus sp. 179-J 7C1 HS]|uniref:DUF6612 family protein n=1 Tax=Ornithinibacillus sp. 179-J 7C1 HS TaxID=3142384 RepID=UPI0039A01CC7
MKKWILATFLVTVSFGLVACSENAEDVFTKALEASEAMESAEVSMKLDQELSMGEEGSITIASDMEGSVINDPLAMHQKGTMSMGMNMQGMESEVPLDMETEIYLVEDEMYMFESLTGQWIKADSSVIPIETLTANQPDVSEQLKMMEKYVEDFEFEAVDEEYVFKLTADGEGFKELSQEMLEDYLPQELTAELGDISQLLEDMEIKTLYIELVIDNKTYDLKEYNMDMEMSMTVEGETVDIVQHVESEYKNINTIDSIEVPQEVKDSAVNGGL